MSSLREVGLTLPEDTSREGCGVQVPDRWKAGTRHLGRLGGAQENQEYNHYLRFWPLRGPLFLAPRMRIVYTKELKGVF